MDIVSIPTPESAPHPALPEGIEGVRFRSRAFAYVIDIIVLSLVNVASGLAVGIPIGVVIGVLQAFNRTSFEFGDPPQAVSLVIGVLLMICYFGLAEGIYGASPGEAILGIRVVDLNWTTCSLRQAFLRGAYRLLDGLFFGLSAYFEMKPPLYQRIGDKRARTLVVSARTPTVPRRHWRGLLIALTLYSLIAATEQVLETVLFLRAV